MAKACKYPKMSKVQLTTDQSRNLRHASLQAPLTAMHPNRLTIQYFTSLKSTMLTAKLNSATKNQQNAMKKRAGTSQLPPTKPTVIRGCILHKVRRHTPTKLQVSKLKHLYHG
jgi:hypothetical protein